MKPTDDYMPKPHSQPKSGVNHISETPPDKIKQGVNQVSTPPKG